MMLKVLVITHFFAPCRNVQSKLNLATVFSLMDAGYEPLIVMRKVPDDLIDNSFDGCIGELKKFFYDPFPSDPLVEKIRMKLNIPQDNLICRGYLRKIYKVAEEVIKKHHIDIIYSISFIGDTARSAKILAKKYKIPWVAEFQDPWLDNFTLNTYMKNHSHKIYYLYWRRRAEYLLNGVLKEADLIVTESEGHQKLLMLRAKKLGIDHNKIMTAHLGTESRVTTKDELRILADLLGTIDIPKIGFVGNIYYGYEEKAKRLVRCLKLLEKEKLPFYFISVGCPTLAKFALEEGLSNNLNLYPVSYHEAISIIDILDWGVTVPSSKIHINSKIFDYIQHNCKVIVWGYPDGDMGHLVKEHNCGIAVDDNNLQDAIIELRKHLFSNHNPTNIEPIPDAWYTRKACLKPVLKRMHELTAVSHIHTGRHKHSL
ncbi:MAG: hypothetical protein QG588_1304 [Candidatus Poribacteria bacterium]|nr:hypothetical protein [Candidatus Poribacteria bacterium]